MSLCSRPVITGQAQLPGKQRFCRSYLLLVSHSELGCFYTLSQHHTTQRAHSQPVSPLPSTWIKTGHFRTSTKVLKRLIPKVGPFLSCLELFPTALQKKYNLAIICGRIHLLQETVSGAENVIFLTQRTGRKKKMLLKWRRISLHMIG